MSWTLHLKFDNDTTDYFSGILSDGASFKECVGAKGKHASQSCSVSILDPILASKIMTATKNIHARIMDGNSVFFEGVIRPFAKLSAEMNRELPLQLEVIDYTETLRRYVYSLVEKTSVEAELGKGKVVETFTERDIAIDALIRKLFSLANLPEHIKINVPSIGIIKKYFCLEPKSYLDDVINDLLYEYCLDYRFSPGSLTVFSTKVIDGSKNPIAAVDSIADFNLSFSVQKEDYVDDGCKVNYGTYGIEKVQIYSEDNRWDSDWWKSYHEKSTGYYFQKGMHKSLDEYKDSVSWTLPDRLADCQIIDITDIELEEELQDEIGVTTSAHCDEWNKDGGKPYIAYDGTFNYLCGTGWGFVLKVNGLVLYRDPTLYQKTVLGLSPVEITTKYIESASDAHALAVNVHARNVRAAYVYSFSSFKALVPGALVSLDENKVTGLGTTVRILSRSYDPITKLYEYRAEGAGAVSIPPVVSSGTAPSVSTVGPTYMLDVKASKTSFIVEEADCAIDIFASGILISQYGCNVQWTFNGSVLADTSSRIRLQKVNLKVGANTVKASCLYNGQVFERTVTLTLVAAALDMSELYEFTVTKTMEPPVKRETFFTFDDYYLAFDEYTIVLDDTWTKTQPVVEPGEFLWLRMPTVDGDYAVIRMTGTPYSDFTVSAEPNPYRNSKRLTTARTVSVSVSYGNIDNPQISYMLVGNPVGVVQDTENPNVFRILPGETPESFTVKVTVIGIGTKTITVIGADVEENNPMYLGRTAVMPPVVSDKLLVDGDWVVYLGEDGSDYKKGHVYKKAGNNWTETTDTKLLSDVYWDTKDLQKENIYARVVFAESLLAENVSVLGEFRFQKDVGDNRCLLTISKDGFEATYGPKTNANNPGIFSFDFDTGKVFIGQPNADKTGASSGFMYDPKRKILISRNEAFSLYENGNLSTINMTADCLNASNAKIYGDSVFAGNLDCGAIVTKKMPESAVKVLENYRTYNQAEQLFLSMYSAFGYEVVSGLAEDATFILTVKSSQGFSSNVKYMKVHRETHGAPMALRLSTEWSFYDKDFNQISVSDIGPIVKTTTVKNPKTILYQEYVDGGLSRSYCYLAINGIYFEYPTGGNMLIMKVKEAPNLEDLQVGEVYSDLYGNLRIKLK